MRAPKGFSEGKSEAAKPMGLPVKDTDPDDIKEFVTARECC